MQEYERYYRDRIVLVTGGAGSIGSNLTRTLAGLGARRVVVLDDLSAGFAWNVPRAPNVELVRASVVDEAGLRRAFDAAPTVVFHLAAFFANQNSVDHPECDLHVNGLGTLRLLTKAVEARVERVVYASSGCSIYGSAAQLPLTEGSQSMYLSTPYQITKMLGELYANFFGQHYGLPVVKTRLFNSFGPGEVPGRYRNVIPNFVFKALRGEPLPWTGADGASRDFTYVGDIVDGLLRAGYIPEAVGEDINIASGQETQILELADKINELTGNSGGIVRAAARHWDTKVRLCASIDKARALLGYTPRTSFDDGLSRTIRWFRDNWSQIEKDADFSSSLPSSNAVGG